MIDYTSQIKYSNFSINKHSLQAIFGISGVVFYDSVISDYLIFLSARLKGKTAKCTCYGKRSINVNSSYISKVTDLSAVGRAVKILLIIDGANIENEYAYDSNGNLIKDLNKNITSISYNVLNLPEVITFANGNSVTYGYDGAGSKLSVTC